MICGRLLFSFLLCLLALVYCNQSESTSSVSNENVARILSLLRSGDEKLNFTGSRDVILVLGNTGSGKSTFTQFLVGKNDDLIAKEVGEGEYIIIDTHDRIGNSTVISKTLIPEKVVSYDEKLIVFDCPGFDDNGRNDANDIAAAYFINRVLQNVKNIKIVLTVSYPSLRKGVNRNDFYNLLEHVSVLIKRVGKYVDGVALIATKVDKTYKEINGVPTVVSDGAVIENIAKFLLEVKDAFKTMKSLHQIYKSDTKRVKNELLFESSNKLLDTLLEKNGTEYSRLGIFRRPDAPGPISASQLLQREKKTIENMLKNRLKYVPVDVADIGYAISEKSKNVIWELEAEIFSTITSDMARLAQLIVDSFKKLERDELNGDMYSLPEALKGDFEGLDRISFVNKSANTNELLMHLRQNLPKSRPPASESILGDMTSLAEFHEFIQTVMETKVDSVTSSWIVELQPAINFFKDSKKWYDFLVALHRRLSEYDVQLDTKRFHVPELGSAPRSLASMPHFTEFFDQISDLDLLKAVNLKELLNIDIDGTKVQYFERVIVSTLQTASAVNSQLSTEGALPRGLVLSGQYVKLSDAIKNSNYRVSHFIQVFATHTVFIDADIANCIDVSIIAPRWVVVGPRTINLNGSPGPSHANLRARDGEESKGNRNGHDGKPGNPGESGGHFFGIGEAFENVQNLTVTAVGGEGGFGQNGGNGARGEDGVSYRFDDHEYRLYCYSNQFCRTNISITTIHDFCSWFSVGEIEYIKYGSDGGAGGNAGRRGAGGLGGLAGSIILLGMGKTKPSFAKEVGRGKEGDAGLHGGCGYGGHGGDHYKITYYFGQTLEPKTAIKRHGVANNGSEGTCLYSSSPFSSNFKNRLEPVPRVPLVSPSLAIKNFRKVLMTCFKNSATKRRALEFYQTLQRRELIQYDGAQLIFRELTTLEDFYNQLDSKVSGVLYHLLLRRIREQFEIVENATESKDRKLLEFSALVVNGQLVRLENKSQFRQVFNLHAYFDLLRYASLPEIRQFFTTTARGEIESAENLIRIVNGDIFDAVERITNEIIQKSKIGVDNTLGDHLIRLKLFENLRVVGDFLALCCSLAEADLDLVSTLFVTSALPSVQTSTYPVNGSEILDDLNTIEETFEKYIDAVRSVLSKERTSLKSVDAYEDVCDQLQDANVLLRSRKSLLAHKLHGYSARFEISDVLQRIHDANKALSKDPNVLARKAANECSYSVKLIDFSPRLYEAFLLEGISPSGVISSMENFEISDHFSEDRVALIDKIANELFGSMAPVLRATRISLTDNSYKPADLMTLRSLVTQALGQIKLRIGKLVTQFEMDDHLHFIIGNIDEAIDTMASIYNGVLLAQHDRALLASFYTHLIALYEFESDAQNYVTGVITAHSLFYEYERLVDVYKEYISPLNVSNLATPPTPNIEPYSLLVGFRFEEFEFTYKREIISNVDILESNLKSLTETISIDTITEQFNSSNQRGVFFKWRSMNYEEAFTKLLRGKKIALKATLVDKNLKFLRFNDIKLAFKSNDSTVQQSLDEHLSNFNVIMTHSGRSYFDLCGHIQLINQDAVRFIYKANESVTEIDDQNAGPMKPFLSPYTTWIFQLKPVNENVTFSSLLPYRNTEITIELEGEATYVNSQNDTVCQSILRNDPGTRVSLGSNSVSKYLVLEREKGANSNSSLNQLDRSSTNSPDVSASTLASGSTEPESTVSDFYEVTYPDD